MSSLNNVSGNYLGTWGNLSQTVHRNDQITLSSNGVLNNAGGGSITNLDYGNVSGTKPPPTADTTKDILESAATSITVNSGNLFQVFGSGSAGVFIGSGGLFGRNTGGGTTFSINAFDGSTAYAGDITGGSDINISGDAVFSGNHNAPSITSVAVSANPSLNSVNGIVGRGNSGNGVYGVNSNGFGSGVRGESSGSSGVGVTANGFSGSIGLSVSGGADISGTLTLSTQTISNLTAGSANSVSGSNVSGTVANASFATTAGSANSVSGSNVSGSVSNSNALGSVSASGWARVMFTESGQANASSNAFTLTSNIPNIRTRATGGNAVLIEDITSDIRLKTDIKPEPLGLDFVNKIETVIFKHNKSAGDKDIVQRGVLAQQLLDILPDGDNRAIVRKRDDGYYTVTMASLIPALINSIQELSAKLNE